ncbi:DUF1194 domain-containing protein [Paralimibaculum aggregatum]|nr:DUF1194 domain-containing protein [Limibaculum sp. NKW23]
MTFANAAGWRGTIYGAVATAMLALPAQAATTVDMELQLLMDISGSVSSSEFTLQRQGYVDAFNDPQVQAAILDTSGGDIGAIAVQFIYWSGAGSQEIAVDWTLIDSAAAASAFASDIAGTSRPFNGSTAPGSAIDFGVPLFASNDFDAAEQVIDVSGDGAQNEGASTSASRDAALAAGIDRINGIYVEGEVGLGAWYDANIKGGTDAFVIAATGFDTFGDALKLKLRSEIQGTTPGQLGDVPLPAPAFMLIGGLAGLAFVGRRRKKAITDPA